ncbi:MAG TPA: serine hydrolase domain-containing protein [Chlamydiales bacterium]|nr:serine hydrolase domain-containing protein [Chlamydiales bacterium]
MKKWFVALVLTMQISAISADPFDVQSPPVTEMVQSLLELQQAGKLDGTALIANGTENVLIYDNSKEKLDPAQGLHGQYFLGSCGKQMMAVALLRALYEQSGNKVVATQKELQRPLIDFLPPSDPTWANGVPEWTSRVTLHQLLTHRSGIPDFTTFPQFFEKNSEGKQFEESPHQTADFLKIIQGQPLDFEPGTKEAYSNTGYTLIKEVIRAITKMPAEEYMNSTLFSKLGMHDTKAIPKGTWHELHEQYDTTHLLKPLRYDPTQATEDIYLTTFFPDSAGSGPITIVSTAIDLLKWNLALHRDYECLPKELYEWMVRPFSKGPTGHGYGYGIAIEQTQFGIAYSHHSSSCSIFYIPSLSASLIALNHVSYDWDKVEPLIQDLLSQHVAAGMSRSEAETQAVQEILQQYPVKLRGHEAINAIFSKFLVSF